MNIELRHRACADESIEERHGHVMARLARIPQPWGVMGKESVSAPDIAADLEVQVGLTPHLGPGVEAYIAYALRSESYLRDNAQYDDRMIVEFDPTEVDFAEVAKTVFPQYVEAFGAYRATIVISDELSLDDWDEICELCQETGKDVNGRDGVHRINSVNFFDRELCRRAFESSPEDIIDRLDGKVETARIVADGVLLIVTADMVDRTGLERIDAAIREQLCGAS